MIRLMLVDDSSFMRTLVKNLVTKGTDIEVVAEAKNGEEAIELFSDQIDVVMLDIEMPKKTGLEVLKEWQNRNVKVPVIMFSSLTKNGARETIQALGLGAFDFIEKPNNPILLNQKRDEILEKIQLAYKKNSKSSKNIKTASDTIKPNNLVISGRPKTMKEIERPRFSGRKNLILIGCSTGGVKALNKIIPMFPKNLNGAIIIVQHMPTGSYIRTLSESLNRTSELVIHEAKDGQKIMNGNVYMAPGGHQIKINAAGEIVVNDDAAESGHAPSVDYMFREVLKENKDFNLIPVVLTGMGGDGSKSSLLMSEKGIETIVESEESCIVFGMPRKVIEIGAKYSSHHLEDIPAYIMKKMK
ncbi:chemotaxis-specific protein-glutamate methyltransferase CheB [Bacillus toyonensis]|uniref:chemotaxis-specific protein-glutamate methyltransferase CheB n=1 Tax=Bacillus toyonensis TaxID=155322 RepID=UPI002E227B2D|nr:chemotaxis-specific protein-glutamate methyltransferase CheB [Bacillus toyonensis]MED2737736.1 chemotaxis-specific protein-glutamate methyltransferase CheB [Bacillus toyonensis]